MSNNNKFGISSLSLAISIALAGSFACTQALAAEDQDILAKVENVERMAVVGSRAAPRSVGESPVPIDIIDGDELTRNGATDMNDLLSKVVPSYNVGVQPISDASTLVRPANMRGLAPEHTLVLVNGKRRPRASVIAFQGAGISDGAQRPEEGQQVAAIW